VRWTSRGYWTTLTWVFLCEANPGTLLWLSNYRPHFKAGCAEYDDYKYGLRGKIVGYASAEAKRLGRRGLVDRYMSRKVHYAFGLVCLLRLFKN
jgi:hypothetical protein